MVEEVLIRIPTTEPNYKLHGAIPVKEAMDRVAAAWERITDDLGRHQ